MNSQVLGIIRHTLTFIGGIFVAKGLLDDTVSQEIVGALVTIIGAVWSIVEKKGKKAA